MTTADVIKIIVPVLTGGLVVWIITTLYNRRQGRIQPVAMTLEITELDLEPRNLPIEIETTITVKTPLGVPMEVGRVFAVRLVLENTTNKDLDQFKFGITFPKDVFMLGEKIETPDRHHIAINKTVPTGFEEFALWLNKVGQQDQQEQDYELSKFDRREKYSFGFAFAPFKIEADRKPDDAGGWVPWTTFTPSFGKITQENFKVGTPVGGIAIVKTTRANSTTKDAAIKLVLNLLFSQACVAAAIIGLAITTNWGGRSVLEIIKTLGLTFIVMVVLLDGMALLLFWPHRTR